MIVQRWHTVVNRINELYTKNMDVRLLAILASTPNVVLMLAYAVSQPYTVSSATHRGVDTTNTNPKYV